MPFVTTFNYLKTAARLFTTVCHKRTERSMYSHALLHHELPPYACKTGCTTQCLSLSIGLNGTISLWEPRTIIKIYVSTKLRNQEHLDHAIRSIDTAIKEWNATITNVLDDPRPRFERVETKREATCQVKFKHQHPCSNGTQENESQQKPKVLADAFFPGDSPEIIVYSVAFEEQYIPYLTNVFYHELIHVQGVRHYFAMQEDIALGRQRSVSIGTDDEFSVSAYLSPLSELKIRSSDVSALKELYAVRHKTYKGLPVQYHSAKLLSSYNCDVVEDGDDYDDDGWFVVRYSAQKA
jgi:hypothetical protein